MSVKSSFPTDFLSDLSTVESGILTSPTSILLLFISPSSSVRTYVQHLDALTLDPYGPGSQEETHLPVFQGIGPQTPVTAANPEVASDLDSGILSSTLGAPGGEPTGLSLALDPENTLECGSTFLAAVREKF